MNSERCKACKLRPHEREGLEMPAHGEQSHQCYAPRTVLTTSCRTGKLGRIWELHYVNGLENSNSPAVKLLVTFSGDVLLPTKRSAETRGGVNATGCNGSSLTHRRVPTPSLYASEGKCRQSLPKPMDAIKPSPTCAVTSN
jgi:hypothetical protein